MAKAPDRARRRDRHEPRGVRARLRRWPTGPAACSVAERPLRAAGLAGDRVRTDARAGVFEVQAVGRRPRELLADYLPYCRSVRIPARLPKLPQCRDANDQMFIELAAIGKADFLVTGDKDLLVLAPMFSERLVTAEAFLVHLRVA